MAAFARLMLAIALTYLLATTALRAQEVGNGVASTTSQEVLTQKIDILEKTTTDLKDKFDFLFWTIAIVGGFFTLFQVGVTFISMRREGQSHKLGLKGEGGAQQRATDVHQKFMGGAYQTMTLVNETLSLAKETSERASRSIVDRANTTLKVLDQRARKIVLDNARKDDRVIISDPDKRAELRGLAERISVFSAASFMLPIEIKLTPHCQFIHGMEFHLKQNYDDAIYCWDSVVRDQDAEKPLESLCWYWIGYENNNLGKFSEAETSFANAVAHADDIRALEIKRLLIETKFFNKVTYRIDDLLVEMSKLLESINGLGQGEEKKSARNKVMVTLGNLHYQRANEFQKEGLHDNAKTEYSVARGKYDSVQGKDKWAVFGSAQARYAMGETSDQLMRLFKFDIKNDAAKEYSDRIEPRTKVLAKTTELFCCKAVKELNAVLPEIKGDIEQALGQVERLTVYSQFQKRNIKKDEFRQEIEEFLNS